MKKWLSEVTPLAAIASLVLGGAGWAGAGDDFGCSNATLKGEYAFCVPAYTPPSLPNGPPKVVNGIKVVFGGQGTLTQRDYQGDNLAGPDFAPRGQETGTYQVKSDCTGSMTINLNVPNVPAGTSSGVIDIMFVISDGGRHIHEVVSQVTAPFFAAPSPLKPVQTIGRSRRRRRSSNEHPSWETGQSSEVPHLLDLTGSFGAFRVIEPATVVPVRPSPPPGFPTQHSILDARDAMNKKAISNRHNSAVGKPRNPSNIGERRTVGDQLVAHTFDKNLLQRWRTALSELQTIPTPAFQTMINPRSDGRTRATEL